MIRSELIANNYAELLRLTKVGGNEEERRALVTRTRNLGLSMPGREVSQTLVDVRDILNKPCVVLVGSMAFEAYCGMRGLIDLPADVASTNDIDIACASQRDIRPEPGTENEHIRRVGDHNVLVEFLTPQTYAQEARPDISPATAYVPLMSSYALVMPGHFRLLLQEPIAVVLFQQAGIEATLPHPMRFAMHKLVVSAQRRRTEKRCKDRHQATIVLNEFCPAMMDRTDIGATFLTYGNGEICAVLQAAFQEILSDLTRPAKDWLAAAMVSAQKHLNA